MRWTRPGAPAAHKSGSGGEPLGAGAEVATYAGTVSHAVADLLVACAATAVTVSR